MLGGGSIQLGRIFGIRIGASPSWFVVLFIMIFALSGYFSDTLTDASSTTAYAVAVAGAAGSPASTCGSSAAWRR